MVSVLAGAVERVLATRHPFAVSVCAEAVGACAQYLAEVSVCVNRRTRNSRTGAYAPQPLLDQLKPGGRMVIPVGPQVAVQQLLLIEKDKDGSVKQRVLEAVRFVPLTRDDTPER